MPKLEKLKQVSCDCPRENSRTQMADDVPKCLLDAADVILSPVSLRDVLLTHRNTTPGNPHDRDIIHVVLVETDLQS